MAKRRLSSSLYRLARSVNDRWGLAFALNTLGANSRILADLVMARTQYEEGAAIARETIENNAGGTAASSTKEQNGALDGVASRAPRPHYHADSLNVRRH